MSAPSLIRIAVDAMGGDYGPAVVVHGALRALPRLGEGHRIVLVGDQASIEREIRSAGVDPSAVDVVHAPANIAMDEAPAAAIRRRRDSSIVIACGMMRDGKVDAFVSAGSTGAVVAGSLLIVGRLPGVARPGIATICPTRKGVCLIIDVGANADCKPSHLVQFAAMGRIYAERVMGISRADVGLLNIGEEQGKGNELAQEAFRQLNEVEPRFIGNVEGRDIFSGRASVVVTDGFVGNVLLKVVEGFAGFLNSTVRSATLSSWRGRIGGLFLRPVLKAAFRRFDYTQYGGAPLLGCKGVSIICHGGSTQEAITNAVLMAERAATDRIGDRIQEEIEREGVAESMDNESGFESGEPGAALDAPKAEGAPS